MASRRFSCLYSVSFLIVFLSCTKQVSAASITIMEAIYVVGAIFFLYLVVNIFLLILLIAVCRHNKKQKQSSSNKKMKQNSVEFREMQRKSSDSSSEVHNETSFDINNVKQSAIRKRSQLVPRESEMGLLDGNQEESITPSVVLAAKAENDEVFEEDDHVSPLGHKNKDFEKTQPTKLMRLESSDFRRDLEAGLVANEIQVESNTPPDEQESTNVSPTPNDTPERPKFDHLLSITSTITGPVVPADSPPPSLPAELKSLDISQFTPSSNSANVETLNTSTGVEDVAKLSSNGVDGTGVTFADFKTFPRQTRMNDISIPRPSGSISLTNTPVHKPSAGPP